MIQTINRQRITSNRASPASLSLSLSTRWRIGDGGGPGGLPPPESPGLLGLLIMDDWSDKALILHLQANPADGEAAFEVLYRRHWKPVISAVRRQVSNADAEDIAQEVFLCLWTEIGSLSHPYNLRAFLRRVAVCKALKYIRKHSRVDVIEATGIDLINLDNQARDSVPRLNEILEACEGSLSPKEYRIFRMRFVDGCPYSEIADSESIKEGNGRGCIHQVKKKIRELEIFF